MYMFDIGQNHLAGAFYSKTLDQVLALIPTILTELETGIKTRGAGTYGYTTQVLLDACLRMLPNLEMIHPSLMSWDASVHITKLLDFSMYSFRHCLENFRVNIRIQMSHTLIYSP